MKPTIEQLNTPDQYHLIESFRVDEMNAFVLRELGMATRTGTAKPSPNKWVAGVSIVLLAGAGAFVGFGLASLAKSGGTGSGWSLLGQALIGLIGFFGVLPVHEAIHGLFFRQIGAGKVGYGGSWKNLLIYAYAQHFVMTLRELALVAVMPFLLITLALGLAWAIWPVYKIVWSTMLVLHTLGCVGDFALIRYYFKNRRRPMYTYDDIEGEQRSYFFEAVN